MADRSSDRATPMSSLLGDPVAADGPALIDGETGAILTHRELADAVRERAEHLARPSKALAFCLCRNDAPTIVNYLAVSAAGHAVLLLDAGTREAVLHDLVARYRPEFILSPGGEEDRAWAPEPAYAPMADGWRRSSAEAEGEVPAIHPDLALLLSTSGSTGSPKFVRLSTDAVAGNARSIAEALGIGATERAVTSLPLHYSYGLSVLNSHLVRGAAVVLTDRGILDAGFWDLVKTRDCTSFAGVPYSYEILQRIGFERFDLPRLSTLTQAGGKLNDHLVDRYHQLMAGRGGRFIVMYGQTEATARIAVLDSEWLPDRLGSAGRAIPGGRLEIELDGAPVREPAVMGEVVYTGPNVMMGYAMERADLARGDELGGRLQTGDLGYLDPDGFLFLRGRLKRISKVLGYRVDLDEVEARWPGQRPVAVVGTDELIVAFCESGDNETLGRLRMELSRMLTVHHSAIQVRRVEALPRTPNGKLDYAELERRIR
jgi:acyl-CoA synthetase (AMP-forming)/AMP-acid ligase II